MVALISAPAGPTQEQLDGGIAVHTQIHCGEDGGGSDAGDGPAAGTGGFGDGDRGFLTILGQP